MTARPAMLAAAVLAAAAVTGCGATTEDSSGKFKGEERLVANTIEDLQSEGQKREASTICSELLTIELANKMRDAHNKKKCSDALHRSLLDADTWEVTVTRVSVAGNRATAVVRSGDKSDDHRTDTLRLVKVGTPRRWRLSALGPGPG